MKENKVEEEIKKIIGENCGFGKANDISPGENLQDLGVTSISFIKVIVSLEKTFGIEFDTDHIELKNFNTVKDIIKYIEERI